MDSRGPGLEKGINSHRVAGEGGLGKRGLYLPSNPIFGRSVNPISTRGSDYAPLITTRPLPPIFKPSFGPFGPTTYLFLLSSNNI